MTNAQKAFIKRFAKQERELKTGERAREKSKIKQEKSRFLPAAQSALARGPSTAKASLAFLRALALSSTFFFQASTNTVSSYYLDDLIFILHFQR